MSSLTAKQAEVLEAIRRHISLTGQSPTVREIGSAVNLRSSCSVQKHLDSLDRLGRIRRSTFKYRSIELADDIPPRGDGTLPVPILGHVAGGPPVAAPADEPELLALPETLLPRVERRSQTDACAARNYTNAPLFAMIVKGDSMVGAGIADGDLVVARRQKTAENGDIVIATVGGQETTVKRYHRDAYGIRLQPENPKYRPLLSRDVHIAGRVTLAIKRF
jgi:repressor LexA